MALSFLLEVNARCVSSLDSALFFMYEIGSIRDCYCPVVSQGSTLVHLYLRFIGKSFVLHVSRGILFYN